MAKKNVEKMPKKERVSTADKLGNFLVKYRVVLLSVICVVVAGLVGYTAYLNVNAKNVEKGLTQVEKIEYTLTKNSAGLSESELAAKYDAALSALEPLTSKGGIIGARALYLKAEIKFNLKDCTAALESYLAAAKKVNKTYLSSICYYCAGVCCEELNDTDKALEYYENAANDPNFCDITHALFNVARLKEAKQDFAGAKAEYEKITAKNNPNDPWANAAHSRILQMQIDGKIE